jgi:hypothetical protein
MLASLDATACAELVKAGEISPRELVEAAIVRIERHNADLGAVIEPLYDEARAAAADPPPGPFRGVPILVKDIGATVGGARHTAGLLPLRIAGHRVPHDSHLVAALRRSINKGNVLRTYSGQRASRPSRLRHLSAISTISNRTWSFRVNSPASKIFHGKRLGVDHTLRLQIDGWVGNSNNAPRVEVDKKWLL